MSNTEVPGGGLLGGVGQPGVDRDQRRLDGEGDEEGQEDPVPAEVDTCRLAATESMRKLGGAVLAECR